MLWFSVITLSAGKAFAQPFLDLLLVAWKLTFRKLRYPNVYCSKWCGIDFQEKFCRFLWDNFRCNEICHNWNTRGIRHFPSESRPSVDVVVVKNAVRFWQPQEKQKNFVNTSPETAQSDGLDWNLTAIYMMLCPAALREQYRRYWMHCRLELCLCTICHWYPVWWERRSVKLASDSMGTLAWRSENASLLIGRPSDVPLLQFSQFFTEQRNSALRSENIWAQKLTFDHATLLEMRDLFTE